MSNHFGPPQSGSSGSSSWEEIAAYLHREARTAQRWGWTRRTTLVQFIWVLEDQERR